MSKKTETCERLINLIQTKKNVLGTLEWIDRYCNPVCLIGWDMTIEERRGIPTYGGDRDLNCILTSYENRVGLATNERFKIEQMNDYREYHDLIDYLKELIQNEKDKENIDSLINETNLNPKAEECFVTA
jgi:hypothetical protein